MQVTEQMHSIWQKDIFNEKNRFQSPPPTLMPNSYVTKYILLLKPEKRMQPKNINRGGARVSQVKHLKY